MGGTTGSIRRKACERRRSSYPGASTSRLLLFCVNIRLGRKAGANMEWKDAVGYEGLFEVSNTGKVRSLKTGTIRKTRIDRYGYEMLTLRKNGSTRTELVHRLVANAFIDNPNGYPQVNHKDENARNNQATNLEWCTGLYNVRYGTGLKRSSASRRKAVECYTLDGQYVRQYAGIKPTGKEMGIRAASITACCAGRIDSAGGYRWAYA